VTESEVSIMADEMDEMDEMDEIYDVNVWSWAGSDWICFLSSVVDKTHRCNGLWHFIAQAIGKRTRRNWTFAQKLPNFQTQQKALMRSAIFWRRRVSTLKNAQSDAGPRHSWSQHTNGTAVESSTANLARDRLGRTLIYSVVRPSKSSPSRSGSRHHLQQAEWLDFFESC